MTEETNEENFDIDPNTGLPELPDEYVWYVGDYRDRPRVCLCTASEEWLEVGLYPRTHDWRVAERTAETRERREPKTTSYNLRWLGIRPQRRFTEAKFTIYTVKDYELALYWEPESIRSAAIKLLDDWMVKVRKAERRASLQGPYPPNKLDFVN